MVQTSEMLEHLTLEMLDYERLEQEILELKASIHGWDPPRKKKQLWELQDLLPTAKLSMEQNIKAIERLCKEARALAPDSTEPQSKLADLYWKLLCQAEQRKDAAAQERFLSLLESHDDGRYADLIEGTATLQLETDPDGALVTLFELEDGHQGYRQREPVDLGPSPVGPIDLAPGRYLLEISLPDHAPTRRPLLVQRGVDIQVQVRLFPTHMVGPDFCYVPAGRSVVGGDEGSPGSGPRKMPFVDNLAMARCPVSVGEYLHFLDDLASADPGQALRYSPRIDDGDRRRDPRLPLTGVSLDAARAYCLWISDRTGVEHRLPTEEEWEKAARGLDGRTFPWGDSFDPSFCHSRRSVPGAAKRVPVGSYPIDESAYGVRDLAGGVNEWTDTCYDDEGSFQVIRGGSFQDGEEGCRAAQRLGAPRDGQLSIGFRLVRPLGPGGGDRISSARVPSSPDDEIIILQARGPQESPRLSIQAALSRVLEMSGWLAATDTPRAVLGDMLSEAIRLVRAERGLLVKLDDGGHEVLEARTTGGEEIPPTDRGFDEEVARAALRQERTIALGGTMPVMAIPLPDEQTCLLLQRRFEQKSFTEESQLVAQAAADPLALALRL